VDLASRGLQLAALMVAKVTARVIGGEAGERVPAFSLLTPI
jgi:hypothetical protein